MTDNRTTELLREGLTERGVEWRSGLEGVTFVGDWCFVEYENGRLAATCEPVLTPDQAIAATLGSDDEYEAKMDELLCYLTNGKFSKSRQYSLDFMKACVDEEYEDAYNELNAELVSGTCRNEWAEFGKFRCSECWTQVDAISTNTTAPIPIKYCPNCGAKVIQGVYNAD